MSDMERPAEAAHGGRERGALPAAREVLRILCVEDLHAVAAALCEAIDRTPGLSSVGTLDSPQKLLSEVKRLKPDVVLFDLYYGGRAAFADLEGACRAGARVLVISGDNHPATVQRALDAGAAGYVVKGDMREIVEAIRAVGAGGSWRPGEAGGGQRTAGADVDALVDALIAALGDPAAAEGGGGREAGGARLWRWHAGRLTVEARAEGEGLVIDLPWPLHSISEPPTFGDLHEEADGSVQLRFAARTAASLELVLGLIRYELSV